MSRKTKKLGLITLFATIGVASVAYAAGIPQDFGNTDVLQVGKGSGTDDKEIILNTGDGATNRKIVVPDAGSEIGLTGNTLSVGDGLASDKVIEANTGAGTPPALRYNNSLTRWEKSNDGVAFLDIGSGAGGGGVNVLENPDFESGVTDWTPSGASTFVVQATSLFGNQSGDWDPSTTGEFLTSDAVTIPVGLQGNQCVVQSFYKWESGSAGDINIQAYDGTNILTQVDLEVTTGSAKEALLVFTCPASGTLSIRYASTTNAAVLTIDRQHLGSNIREVQVASSELFGQISYEAKASCNWIMASGTWADAPLDTDCDTTTLIGRATDPATEVPGLLLPSMPPGRYKVSAQGQFLAGINTICSFRISDGTNSGPGVRVVGEAGTSLPMGQVDWNFEVTSAQANVQLEMQSIRLSGTNGCDIQNDNTTERPDFTMTVTRFPLDSEKAIAFDQANWHIDANIGATSNPLIGTGAQSAYVEITDPDLDLVTRPGSASVQIACASGTAPEGSTCNTAAVNESLGIAFDPPFAGKYEVCAENTFQVQSGVSVTFQLIETTTTSSAILQEGGSRTSILAPGTTVNHMSSTCGTFEFASTGKKVIRLMYEKIATANQVVVFIDRQATQGQLDLHWTVKPITQFKGGIRFDNMISTALAAGWKAAIYAIHWQGTGVPAVLEDPAGVVDNVVDEAAGDVTVNYVSGTFTNPPMCFCTSEDNDFRMCSQVQNPRSASLSRWRMFNDTGSTQDPASTNEGVSVVCLEPKS